MRLLMCMCSIRTQNKPCKHASKASNTDVDADCRTGTHWYVTAHTLCRTTSRQQRWPLLLVANAAHTCRHPPHADKGLSTNPQLYLQPGVSAASTHQPALIAALLRSKCACLLFQLRLVVPCTMGHEVLKARAPLLTPARHRKTHRASTEPQQKTHM